MRLEGKESWSRDIGRFIKITKRQYIWKFIIEGESFEIELQVSHLTGKNRLFANSILIKSQRCFCCGRETLSGEFKGLKLMAGPSKTKSLNFDLEINGKSFSSPEEPTPCLFNPLAPKRKMNFCFESEVHKVTLPPETFDQPDFPRPLAIDSSIIPYPLAPRADSDLMYPVQFFSTQSSEKTQVSQEVFNNT